MRTAIHDIQFTDQVIETISGQIAKYGLLETGGVLLGQVEKDILVVSHASDCGPKAVHEIDYFRADANYVDMFIDMGIGNSGGKIGYLGEWHTHPQVKPYPSNTDFRSLTEIACTAEDFVLMLIVGAVRYKSEKFFTQHIAILKYKEDDNFYKY